MAQNRFLYRNRTMDSETILTPSSEVATLPAMFLKDQLRQKPWRTKLGWTIVAGFNDKLDFNRGGVKVATITPGTYVSGADIGAAIVAALEAADPTGPTWAVSYNVVAPNKFRIFDSAGAPVVFSLLWSTGANAATSIGKDLGFDTAADDSGTSTYTADNVAYQSRHFLKINRSDGAQIAATAFMLLDHNLFGIFSPTQTVKVQGNATDSWASPAVSFTFGIVATANPAVVFFPSGEESEVWWRVLIEQVQVTAGYVEIGIVYLGPDVAPSINPSVELSNDVEDFTAVETGIDGTHFIDTHRYRDRWAVSFREMEAADKAILDALEVAVRVGENFFLCWNNADPSDRGDGTTGTTYGFMAAGFRKQYVAGDYWTYSFLLFEAL